MQVEVSRKIRLRAGDYVEVRTLRKILATLDANGCFEGLPFMPEMVAYCGKSFRVFKRIDKIIDMVNNAGPRRMSGTVTLLDIRCDGHAHGGCQTGCQLLWKEAWLRRSASNNLTLSADSEDINRSGNETLERKEMTLESLNSLTCKSGEEKKDQVKYSCQATELYNASCYFSWWDLRQYFSPLWSGNITLAEFFRVILIDLFNLAQQFRGRCTYPYLEPGNLEKTPSFEAHLMPGEMVQVKTQKEIQATLDKRFRNRGLWFDKEMIRFCGGYYRVLRRVDRAIDESTGKLIKFKNPCIILDGVTSKGEFRRFNPQNEFIFWKEIWLKRVATE